MGNKDFFTWGELYPNWKISDEISHSVTAFLL
jgi:hypothetical protein